MKHEKSAEYGYKKKGSLIDYQSSKRQGQRNPQIKLLAECFSEKPKTMYQVEQETGVKNDNISRFIVKDEEKLYQTQGGQLETSLSHTGNSESMRATENTLRTISNYHY